MITSILGIGRGAAIAFAQAGCQRFLLGDVNEAGLHSTREVIIKQAPSADVDIAYLDVTDEVSMDDFGARCVARFGRLDYACNIAGICPPRTPVIDVDVATYDKVVAVNLYGVSRVLCLLFSASADDSVRHFYAIPPRSARCSSSHCRRTSVGDVSYLRLPWPALMLLPVPLHMLVQNLGSLGLLRLTLWIMGHTVFV